MIRDILNQLLDVYYLKEHWHKNKMTIKEAKKYHNRLLKSRNIICYEEDGELLGYFELWKVTPKQLNVIISNNGFSAYHENVNDGNIAYLANLWIKPNMRKSHVYKMLKIMWFNHTKSCSHYSGEEVKRNNRLRMFKSRRFENG